MKLARVFTIAVSAGLLGACTAPSGDRTREVNHPNIEPTNYEPGLHISGHVNVGVVSSF
jgi:hypothetical protein